jgi:hypothetical protein
MSTDDTEEGASPAPVTPSGWFSKASNVARVAMGVKGGLVVAMTGFCLAGLVVLLWLGGRVLFFWDVILPFKADRSLYFYSYAWLQVTGNGQPGSPFEFGSYFPIMAGLQTLGLSLAASQCILIYALFVTSGVSMFLLARFIFSQRRPDAGAMAFPACSAFFYMFNFYVTMYALSTFYESLFLYSVLPLAILLLLKGYSAARTGRPYWTYLAALVVVFEMMSTGFWEPPYLVSAGLCLIGCVLLLHRSMLREIVRISRRELGYLALCVASVCATSLWWLSSTFNFVSLLLFGGNWTTSGQRATEASYVYSAFSGPSGDASERLLNLLAVYPQSLPGTEDHYSWTALYFAQPWSIIFLLIAVLLVVVVWTPLLAASKERASRGLVWLYALIAILVLLGLQGNLEPTQGAYLLAYHAGVPLLSALYVTNLQFIQLPLVFIYALLFGLGIERLYPRLASRHSAIARSRYESNLGIGDGATSRRPAPRRWRMGKAASGIVVAVAIIIVAAYPGYMYTPAALQEYSTPSGVSISPTIGFPSSIHALSNFLQQNSGNKPVLLLPISFNFFSATVGNESFADTGPIGFVTGTPVLSANWPGSSDTILEELNSLMYRPNSSPTSFGKLLETQDVEYIVATLNYTGAGNYLYYNASTAVQFLSSRPDFREVASFGNFLVFENGEITAQVWAASPVCFDPSLIDATNLFNSTTFYSNTTVPRAFDSLPLASSLQNGVLTLKYNGYVPGYERVYWLPKQNFSVELGKYNYLEITFRSSSPSFQVFVYGQAGFTYGPFLSGLTVLSALNPTPTLPATYGIYSYSPAFYTLVFPLFNQTVRGYSTASAVGSPSMGQLNLSSFGLGINVTTGTIPGAEGYVQIQNITFLPYYNSADAVRFMESTSFDPATEVLTSECANPQTEPTRTIPRVNYTEVNPSQYTVRVRDTTGALSLVLGQTFDENWSATIDGVEIARTHHTIGDLYANVWAINLTGNFSVLLYYVPQSITTAVVWISELSLGVVIAAVVWRVIPARTKSKVRCATHLRRPSPPDWRRS